MESRPIRIAGLALIHDAAVLLVRKKGTVRFMLPGGKYEGRESALACLRRELAEELAVDTAALRLTRLGRFEAPAANEPGRAVSPAEHTAGYRALPEKAMGGKSPGFPLWGRRGVGAACLECTRPCDKTSLG